MTHDYRKADVEELHSMCLSQNPARYRSYCLTDGTDQHMPLCDTDPRQFTEDALRTALGLLYAQKHGRLRDVPTLNDIYFETSMTSSSINDLKKRRLKLDTYASKVASEHTCAPWDDGIQRLLSQYQTDFDQLHRIESGDLSSLQKENASEEISKVLEPYTIALGNLTKDTKLYSALSEFTDQLFKLSPHGDPYEVFGDHGELEADHVHILESELGKSSVQKNDTARNESGLYWHLHIPEEISLSNKTTPSCSR